MKCRFSASTELSECTDPRSFARRCAIALPFLDSESPSFTPGDVKQRSPLLFYAIVAVGSREDAELEAFHRNALQETMTLHRATLGGTVPSLYDLMGSCIVSSWLSPVRPPGESSISGRR